MADIPGWLIGAGVAVVLIPLFAWLGVAGGRRAARRYPGMAMTLWMLGNFLKIDPPPPPKAERVVKSEDDNGAPPAP